MADYDITNLNASLNGTAINGIRNVVFKNTTSTYRPKSLVYKDFASNNYTWNETRETLSWDKYDWNFPYVTYSLKVYYRVPLTGTAIHTEYIVGSASAGHTSALNMDNDDYGSHVTVPYASIYEIVYTRKTSSHGKFSLSDARKALIKDSNDTYGVKAYEEHCGQSGIVVTDSSLTIKGLILKSTKIYLTQYFTDVLTGATTNGTVTVYNTTVGGTKANFINTNIPSEGDFLATSYYVRVKTPSGGINEIDITASDRSDFPRSAGSYIYIYKKGYNPIHISSGVTSINDLYFIYLYSDKITSISVAQKEVAGCSSYMRRQSSWICKCSFDSTNI